MADPIETMYKIIRRIKRRYNCSTGLPRPSEPGSSAAHDHLGSLHAACADPSYCGCHNRHPCGSSSRSEEHTSELQSLMRISYAVFCWKKKINTSTKKTKTT